MLAFAGFKRPKVSSTSSSTPASVPHADADADSDIAMLDADPQVAIFSLSSGCFVCFVCCVCPVYAPHTISHGARKSCC